MGKNPTTDAMRQQSSEMLVASYPFIHFDDPTYGEAVKHYRETIGLSFDDIPTPESTLENVRKKMNGNWFYRLPSLGGRYCRH